jgi:NAD-dependent dihydropyrimidine dehydrogenase PreA subunit
MRACAACRNALRHLAIGEEPRHGRAAGNARRALARPVLPGVAGGTVGHEERMESKLKLAFVPKKRGLGIEDAFKRLVAIRPSTWRIFTRFFKLLVRMAPVQKYPILGALYRRVLFWPKDRPSYATQGVTFDINLDLSKKSENVVVPVELMKKAVREAGYRVALNRCICRSSAGCTTFPHDVACLFLGQAGRTAVKNGIGREVTADEACALIDRAAGRGLVGQALWIEVEQYVWGVENKNMERFLELCFCCPCCCTALRVVKHSPEDVKARFRSIGWKATVSEECVGCETCVPGCPQDALSLRGDRVEVNERCFGCGLCVPRCPTHAIDLELRSPLKPDLKDYFVGLDFDLR